MTAEPVIPDVVWRGLASLLAFAAAILLIALVGLVYISNTKRDEDHARERHSYEVMTTTYGLGGAIESSEAALGRYVMSGDRQVGTRYYHEWLRAGSALGKLKRLTYDDPASSKLVGRFEALYALHGKDLAQAATLANYKKGWAAISLFYKVGQKPEGPAMRAILRQLALREQGLLARRADEAQASAERSNMMAALLSFLGICLVLSAAALGAATVQAVAQRGIARRNFRREQERAETLEARVAERTRELEGANRRLRAEAQERAQAEATLRQVQKMEAVGQLTGGIAHDFNNMLAVVVGGVEIALRRLSGRDAEARRHLENAMEGANRAAELTRRLLALARSEPLLPESVDAEALIGRLSELLDRTLGERIRIDTDFTEPPWPVWADPHQFENALLNLAVNARDAMAGEGTLHIETANVHVSTGTVPELAPGPYLRIAVSDTGEGMPEQVMERAFEPFFTTKPVGKGTGLGLAQVFAFARQSHGAVTIKSELSSGTTVSIYLPRHGDTVSAPAIPALAPAPPPGEKPVDGVVLVVEDDPRVRATTIAGLTELGHAPLPCGSGEEALEVMARRQDVRLVVSDIVMPGMSGVELVGHIGSQHPGTAILMVTGFTGEAETGDLSGYEILRKPFTLAALQRGVDNALARAVSGPRRPPAVSAEA
ncbi:ATP-binding protein [Sphingomonas sp. ID0503]|uniref:ATP-binding protein n=1 Tax=Sphingomonas sp. ID0503 TaxID=3399691 RepID=UPI003AFB27E0